MPPTAERDKCRHPAFLDYRCTECDVFVSAAFYDLVKQRDDMRAKLVALADEMQSDDDGRGWGNALRAIIEQEDGVSL